VVNNVTEGVPRLPAALCPAIEFAYITAGAFRQRCYVAWHQVDFDAGENRLDPETTKNRDGRVFPMTDDLRALLKERGAERDRLKKAGTIESRVFFRMVAKGRRGPKSPRPIVAFTKAWKAACVAAGCPGRIPAVGATGVLLATS
jgi:hypothetical protein